MHEMSMSLETANLIVDSAHQQGFKKVTAVWLEIGALSCIEADTLIYCLELAIRDTLAEGSTIHLIPSPGKAYCFNCQKEVELVIRGEPCPSCQGFQLKVMQGDELRIKEIEVE